MSMPKQLRRDINEIAQNSPRVILYGLQRMLEDEQLIVFDNTGVMHRVVAVDLEKETIEVSEYIITSSQITPIKDHDYEKMFSCRPTKDDEENDFKWSPDFWRAALLKQSELGKICDRLMTLQSAHVTAASVMGDMDDEPMPEPTVEKLKEQLEWYKMQYKKGLGDCCRLIQHIHAMKEAVYGVPEDPNADV